MYLGGTGSTATAVTSGTSAEEDDDITGIGGLTDDIFAGSSAHNSTDLHTLCHVRGMIDLFYKSGSQTDLVTVRGITAGCASYQFLLGQLAVQCLGYGNGRIRRTGDTHCLIYIATTGQGITDSTAQTGGSATERLDLSRMVVGLVLEKYQPLLSLSVVAVIHLHRNHYGAGIDLIRFFHVVKFAVFFQLPHCHQRQIHQADELVLSALEDFFSGIQIALVSGL